MLRRLFLIATLALLPFGASRAILEIQITQGASTAAPVAVVPFGWEVSGPAPATDVAQVIGADLTRSGRFKAVPEKSMLEKPTQASAIHFTNWRVLGVNDLVIGRIKPAGSGNYQVSFQLFNVYTGKQLLGMAVLSTPQALRWTAHKISDLIYHKLTGQRGAFATRIAYVEISRKKGAPSHYKLMVADSDGFNPQTVFSSNEPIMSPAWSPDGKHVAYVSFESKLPAVYVQNIYTGKRQLISHRSGLNGAPAFSPDGKSLALVLSSSPGNPDIYVMNLATHSLRRITHSSAIDTEPAWSPNGQSLYFTSNRGGSAQIYKVSLGGGTPQRITFNGNYNARARVSANGDMLAMVHREDGHLHIAVMNLDTGALLTLTKGDLDKSPSFAPNGSMIIYEADYHGHGVLAEVSVDGQVHERLSESQAGVSVHAPVWGPFLSQ